MQDNIHLSPDNVDFSAPIFGPGARAVHGGGRLQRTRTVAVIGGIPTVYSMLMTLLFQVQWVGQIACPAGVESHKVIWPKMEAKIMAAISQ